MLELKQTRENAFNEIIQTRMDTDIQETSLIYGANLAGVLAKACHRPMTLSESESLILHNFFTVQMHHARKVRWLEELRATPSGIEWQTFAAPFISRILSYPGGQTWLSGHPFYRNQEMDFGAFLRASSVTPEYSCKDIKDRVTQTSDRPTLPEKTGRIGFWKPTLTRPILPIQLPFLTQLAGGAVVLSRDLLPAR